MRFLPTIACCAAVPATLVRSWTTTRTLWEYNTPLSRNDPSRSIPARGNTALHSQRRHSSNSDRLETKDSEEDLYIIAAAEKDAGNSEGAAAETATTPPPPPFATSYHAPVMWQECVAALLAASSKADSNAAPHFFVDGTLGGGGHAAALLQTLRPGDILFGADVDPDALSVASERLRDYRPSKDDKNHKPWFIPVRSNFADLHLPLLLEVLLETCRHADHWSPTAAVQDQLLCDGVDGLLLDLGVSSHQIDTADRGFAFMKPGPLDMRMDKGGGGRLTAADLCNECDAMELRRIFQTYGDEPRATAIAESLVQRRPLRTTHDLFEAVAAVTPAFAKKGRRMGRMATMARIFQSLRIVVNEEDEVLERALQYMAPSLLRPGGRLVVLSYHSMEDRATKRVMRDGTTSKREAEWNNGRRDLYGNHIGDPKPFRTVGKAQKATAEEVAQNVRARSATMRVAEKL
jgi:16S rRNA (cytosine1402-N4)-methyltransferase